MLMSKALCGFPSGLVSGPSTKEAAEHVTIRISACRRSSAHAILNHGGYNAHVHVVEGVIKVFETLGPRYGGSTEFVGRRPGKRWLEVHCTNNLVGVEETKRRLIFVFSIDESQSWETFRLEAALVVRVSSVPSDPERVVAAILEGIATTLPIVGVDMMPMNWAYQ
jgi:hypothetical protein